MRDVQRFFLGMVNGNAMGYALEMVEGEVEGKVESCALGLFLGLVDGDALCNALEEVEGKVEGCAIGL